MTYDPNRDFRDPNELSEIERNARNMDLARGSNASWGWLLGGVAAVVLVLIALTFARDDTNTAGNTTTPPATTTGQSTTPPATANRPSNPPSTTGQAPADRPAPAPKQ